MQDLLKDLEAKWRAIEVEWIPPNCQSLRHFAQSTLAAIRELAVRVESMGEKPADKPAPKPTPAKSKSDAPTVDAKK